MQPPILEDSHTDRIKSLVHQLRAAMDDDPYSIPSIFDKLVEADPQLPRRLSQIPGAAEQLFVGNGGYDWVINQDRSSNQRVQLVSLTSQERGTLDRVSLSYFFFDDQIHLVWSLVTSSWRFTPAGTRGVRCMRQERDVGGELPV